MDQTMPNPDHRPEFYAGVMPKRAIAWVIDLAIAVIIAAMIVPFTFFVALFFFPFLMLLVSFLYRWVTVALFGATTGMWLMALEMRASDGECPDTQTAFVHAFGTTAVFAIFPLHLLSIAMILVGERGQSLMDMLLDTVILNRAYQPR